MSRNRHDLADDALGREGLFEVFIPKRTEVFRYQLRGRRERRVSAVLRSVLVSSRRWARRISICSTKGTSTASTKNSARTSAIVDGVHGVSFAVWAPAAKQVSVVRQFQSLGRSLSSHAVRWARPACGNFSFPDCRKANSTNSRSGISADTSG